MVIDCISFSRRMPSLQVRRMRPPATLREKNLRPQQVQGRQPTHRTTRGGPITKRGFKDLSARKSLLSNTQNAGGYVRFTQWLLLSASSGGSNALHWQRQCVAHRQFPYGHTFVASLKYTEFEQFCCSTPRFYACKTGVKIPATVFTSAFMAANQQA